MDKVDKRLVNAIQSGDEEAFETLFFKYYDPLWRFTCRYVDSPAIAEDIVQQVFATIWEMQDQLGSLGKIRPYLYRAVKNQALDYQKHEEVVQKYELEVEFQFYNDEHRINKVSRIKEGFREAAQNAIEELPDHTRHIYKMSRNEGLTYREIAGVLEISVKTVESHITKALRFLRDRLSHYLPFFLTTTLLYEFIA